MPPHDNRQARSPPTTYPPKAPRPRRHHHRRTMTRACQLPRTCPQPCTAAGDRSEALGLGYAATNTARWRRDAAPGVPPGKSADRVDTIGGRGNKGNMPTIGEGGDTRLEGGRDAKQLADGKLQLAGFAFFCGRLLISIEVSVEETVNGLCTRDAWKILPVHERAHAIGCWCHTFADSTFPGMCRRQKEGVHVSRKCHKVVPFSSCTNCQHLPALVSVHLTGPRDRHLSKLQWMTLSPMTRQDVPPLLTLSGAVLEAQWDRVCHIKLSDRCRRPVGREEKKKPPCLIFGTRIIWCFAEKWSMHVCANKHAHPTTASIDPCCRETHYITCHSAA